MPRPKRLLFGVTVDHQIQYHRSLAVTLSSAGNDVHFVSSGGPQLRQLSGTLTTHTIAMVRRPHLLKDIPSFRSWIRLLRSVQPDVVIVGTPKAGLLGITAARILSVPQRIYFVHGLRYQSAKGFTRRGLMALERLVLTCATGVLAVSESVRTALSRDKVSRKVLVSVAGRGSAQGVDLDVFRPVRSPDERLDVLAELGLEPGLKTLGYLGRLTRAKGLDELADALTMLAQRGVHLQVLLVGPIDDESGGRAYARLCASGIKCVTTGYTPRPDRYLRAMDVLCLPTHREGLGNAILEAFATGLPVVSTNVTGVIDLIVDNETGILVEVQNPGKLADALQRILEDDALAKRLAAAAEVFVKKHFSVQAVTSAQIEYLETAPSSRARI